MFDIWKGRIIFILKHATPRQLKLLGLAFILVSVNIVITVLALISESGL